MKKKLSTKEVFEIVPKGAKNMMCVLRYGEDVNKFKNVIVRQARKSAVQRVIIAFHKDIPKKYGEKITKDICLMLRDDNAKYSIHVMGRGGFSNGDIKKLVRQARKNKVNIRNWDN